MRQSNELNTRTRRISRQNNKRMIKERYNQENVTLKKHRDAQCRIRQSRDIDTQSQNYTLTALGADNIVDKKKTKIQSIPIRVFETRRLLNGNQLRMGTKYATPQKSN